KNNFFNSIKEKEYIVPFAINPNVSFITTNRTRKLVRIKVNKRLSKNAYSIGIIKNSLVRNINLVNILHDGSSFSSTKTIINIIGQNKAKNMIRSINFRQRNITFDRGSSRQRLKVDIESSVNVTHFKGMRLSFK